LVALERELLPKATALLLLAFADDPMAVLLEAVELEPFPKATELALVA